MDWASVTSVWSLGLIWRAKMKLKQEQMFSFGSCFWPESLFSPCGCGKCGKLVFVVLKPISDFPSIDLTLHLKSWACFHINYWNVINRSILTWTLVINRTNGMHIFRMLIWSANWRSQWFWIMWIFLFTPGSHFCVLSARSNGAGCREVHGRGVWMVVVQNQITVRRPGQPWVLSVQPEVIPVTSSPKLCYLQTIQPLKQMLQEASWARGRKVWKFSAYNKSSGRLGDGISDVHWRAWKFLFEVCGGSTDVTSYWIWNRNGVGVLGWRKVLNVTFLPWNSGKDWGSSAWVSMNIQSFRQLMRSLL